MANGADQNLRRLLMACTVYRQKCEEWPSQARMSPIILHDLARLLDQEDFERLAAHLQMRTKDRMGISVGGRGVVDYDDVDHERIEEETVALAERWLGVEVRRDIDHD